jgi:hypothetical protein
MTCCTAILNNQLTWNKIADNKMPKKKIIYNQSIFYCRYGHKPIVNKSILLTLKYWVSK